VRLQQNNGKPTDAAQKHLSHKRKQLLDDVLSEINVLYVVIERIQVDE
jgi:hypothetical protein